MIMNICYNIFVKNNFFFQPEKFLTYKCKHFFYVFQKLTQEFLQNAKKSKIFLVKCSFFLGFFKNCVKFQFYFLNDKAKNANL